MAWVNGEFTELKEPWECENCGSLISINENNDLFVTSK